nr:transposase [uncultured Desulfuromonas sp.]
MPRSARLVIPNYPHHVIQRGHNRQTVFASDDDYSYYLDNLAQWKETLKCKVYAFCLMTNHVHLVIDPGENPENLGKLMKRVAGRQTRFVNRLEGRSGSLWEGRFKSSPIDSDSYLLSCCRYVEMNPVAAGICAHPAEYPWSSCRSKLERKYFSWLDFDPIYLDLGKNETERSEHYHEFLEASPSTQEQETIRLAVQRGQLTGGERFVDEIEQKLNRRIELRGQGRPRKVDK